MSAFRAAMVGAASIVLAATAACAPPRESGRVACPASVVIVPEDRTPACDVRPPSRMDVEMRRDAGAPARCAHMGGRFVAAVDPDAGEDVCVGVDY